MGLSEHLGHWSTLTYCHICSHFSGTMKVSFLCSVEPLPCAWTVDVDMEGEMDGRMSVTGPKGEQALGSYGAENGVGFNRRVMDSER